MTALRRRDALLLGAGTGAAVLLASCGGDLGDKEVTQTVSPDQMKSDAAILASLLELERMAVLAYSTAQHRLSGGLHFSLSLFRAIIRQQTSRSGDAGVAQ